MDKVILQVFPCPSGQWGGRIMRGDKEDGRVAGCESQEDVKAMAMGAGIAFDQVDVLDYTPPVA